MDDIIAENLATRAVTVQLLALPHDPSAPRQAWLDSIESRALAYVGSASISLTQAEQVRANAAAMVQTILREGRVPDHDS